jgi:hypothetical protein
LVKRLFTTDRSGTYSFWNTTNPYPGPPATSVPYSARYSQDLLISQGHPYRKLGKDDSGDIGGSFYQESRILQESANQHGWDVFDGARHFTGGQYAYAADVSNSHFPSVPPSSDSVLNAIGTQVIANVIPTNPVSGLFVSLMELKREGIPSVPGIQSWRERTLRARNAGSEYLNYEFGWLPLVNELKSFTHAVTHSDELVRQYERNSGKRIKRRVTLPTTFTKDVVVQENSYPSPTMTGGIGTNNYNGQGTRTRTSIIKKERWFSGCFTYYLPPYNPGGNNLKRNEQLANYLYGTRVTPEGIWNLTPWSWAADWVTNFGDVVHNVSAFRQDGLVMPYAYMMERNSCTHIVVLTQKYKGYSAPKGTQVFTQSFTFVGKRRVGATPYGFGLNPASFTNRQWSILAALGLSRGSKQMKYQ